MPPSATCSHVSGVCWVCVIQQRMKGGGQNLGSGKKRGSKTHRPNTALRPYCYRVLHCQHLSFGDKKCCKVVDQTQTEILTLWLDSGIHQNRVSVEKFHGNTPNSSRAISGWVGGMNKKCYVAENYMFHQKFLQHTSPLFWDSSLNHC